VPAYPTYTSTDPTLTLTVVEHLDGKATTITFPYTPVSQEEAWLFEEIDADYFQIAVNGATVTTFGRAVYGLATYG
jgi:hypothetical protein